MHTEKQLREWIKDLEAQMSSIIGHIRTNPDDQNLIQIYTKLNERRTEFTDQLAVIRKK
jgi:hypothetical protein